MISWPRTIKLIRQVVVATALVMVALLPGWIINELDHSQLSRAQAQMADGETAIRGYGFSTSLSNMTPAQADAKLEAMRAAGASWVRYDLNWSAVQQGGPQSYEWAAADRMTAAARAHGFEVIMAVGLTPPWARVAGCDSELCAPADTAAYARFVGEAARHYRSYGVRHWEIWNEPNISYRFRPGVDAPKYVVMLKGAYTAIKAADPGATVIAASTAPSATDDRNLRPLDFLRAMYAAGAAGSFDAVSAHPYTYPLTPSQSSPYDAWGQLEPMHELMQDHGDGGKRIWLTEFGAPTNGPNLPGEYVSEEVQARIATEGIAMFRDYDWSGPLLWYDFQDTGTGTWTSEYFYGLVRADGSHKPAYDAFYQAAAQR